MNNHSFNRWVFVLGARNCGKANRQFLPLWDLQASGKEKIETNRLHKFYKFMVVIVKEKEWMSETGHVFILWWSEKAFL